MLDDRRTFVISEGPLTDQKAKNLLDDLANWAQYAGDKDEDRDVWLVRLAGAALYLLHPEDEAKVAPAAALETHDTQWVFVGAVRASAVYVCGLFWSNGQPCNQVLSVPSGERVTPTTHAYHNPDPAPGLAGTHTHRGVDGRVMQLNPEHTVINLPGKVPAGPYQDEHEVPFTVVKRGGRYKRKPRPDVGA